MQRGVRALQRWEQYGLPVRKPVPARVAMLPPIAADD